MAFPEVARVLMTVALAGIGVALLIWPEYLFGIRGHFEHGTRTLDWIEKRRLQETILARQQAEGGSSRSYGTYFGIGLLALAALECIRAVPVVVPYSIAMLALAFAFFFAYHNFARVAKLRAAPLDRRSIFRVLPLTSLLPIIVCMAVGAVYATFPEQRWNAIFVELATLLLGITAWRIAAAPALLLGSDPEFEYVVDERVRRGRAVSVATVACLPVLMLNLVARDVPPLSRWPYVEITSTALLLAQLTTVFTGFFILRRPLAIK